MPPEVRQAKRIKYKIGAKAETGTGTKPFSLEHGFAPMLTGDDDDDVGVDEPATANDGAANGGAITGLTLTGSVSQSQPQVTPSKRAYSNRSTSGDFLEVFKVSLLQAEDSRKQAKVERDQDRVDREERRQQDKEERLVTIENRRLKEKEDKEERRVKEQRRRVKEQQDKEERLEKELNRRHDQENKDKADRLMMIEQFRCVAQSMAMALGARNVSDNNSNN